MYFLVYQINAETGYTINHTIRSILFPVSCRMPGRRTKHNSTLHLSDIHQPLQAKLDGNIRARVATRGCTVREVCTKQQATCKDTHNFLASLVPDPLCTSPSSPISITDQEDNSSQNPIKPSDANAIFS